MVGVFCMFMKYLRTFVWSFTCDCVSFILSSSVFRLGRNYAAPAPPQHQPPLATHCSSLCRTWWNISTARWACYKSDTLALHKKIHTYISTTYLRKNSVCVLKRKEKKLQQIILISATSTMHVRFYPWSCNAYDKMKEGYLIWGTVDHRAGCGSIYIISSKWIMAALFRVSGLWTLGFLNFDIDTASTVIQLSFQNRVAGYSFLMFHILPI